VKSISGKIIVVTGASSGIGEASAKRLAALGAQVALVARRQDELVRVHADIVAAGGQASVHAADLSDRASLEACADRILERYRHIDVLVNNAGRSIRRLVSESTERFHDYERTMQINYFAPVALTLKVLPSMLARGSGQIVNVTSFSTLLPVPRFSAYAASKAALETFSRSLSAELVGKDITVTLVHYPLVKTPMTAPTKAYSYMKQMPVEEAADWMVRAIVRKPARIATKSGRAWTIATSILPSVSTSLAGRWLLGRAARIAKKIEADEARDVGRVE
jgi:short-subunit dehydrogenase